MVEDIYAVKALPGISTLQLDPGERAIGRLTSLALPAEPAGPAAADLAGDAFFEAFLGDPQSRPAVPPERNVNAALLDWLRSTHGYQQSRAVTAGNLPASITAAGLTWSLLQNEAAIKAALDRQEEAAEAGREAQAKQMAANAMQQAAQATGDGQMAAEAQAMQAEANAARTRAQAAAAAAQALIDAARGKPLLHAAVAAAARAAAEKAAEVAEAAGGWGLGPGSRLHTDPAAALEFLRGNQGKVAQIARLAGRLRGFALTARRNRVPLGVVPAMAGLTQDLTRAFPSELALLRPDAPAVLRAAKIAQFAEAGLLGYKPAGDAKERGPFVAAVDVSPSMRGPREIVAKAVALGVAQAARQEGRPYILFTFASDPTLMTAVESGGDWPAHLAWAGDSHGGGTNFDMALAETIARLRQLGRQGRGADALFISDGEAGVLPESRQAWQAFAAETGARLFYVPVVSYGLKDIEDTADRVIYLSELDEAAGASLAATLGGWLR